MSENETGENEAAGGPVHTPRAGPAPLSQREREVFELLADGLSGAQIAQRLVLSPETVRTHIRNGMRKLGASTRSQAVVIALRRREIASGPELEVPPAPSPVAGTSPARAAPEEVATALTEAMEGLLSLWDVDAGWVYLADDGGLTLRQVVERKEVTADGLPGSIALGEGPLGRAALERRPQVVNTPGADTGALIVAPLLDGGRLIGVIGLGTRPSRPTGRQEQLLLQALAARISELIASGGPRLAVGMNEALQGFRASWVATTRTA